MPEVITYWDSVLVADNCLPEDIFNKARKILDHQFLMSEGLVDNTPKEQTSYSVTEQINADFVADWILESGFIPLLENHDIEYVVRHHRMQDGGKMAWHCDGCYSIAATAYFSNCEGGELEVRSKCETHSISIKPRINRVVVIKCDNMHRVSEVRSGPRDSLQIFYTFLKRSE